MVSELIEIDLATGEEDHWIMTGTFESCHKQMLDLIGDADEEWGTLDTERYGITWPTYRIQPA